MKNILITSAGKRVVLVQIFQQTLQEMGLGAKVYTTDMFPKMAPAGIISDGCMHVPPCTADNYIDSLLNICREKQIGVIIPTIDTELLVLAENHQRFMNQDVRLAVPDKEFVIICGDKRRTRDFFLQAGISVPMSVDKHHPIFPMFAKPYDGSLSNNIHIIRREEDLTPSILEDPKLIFMEYIDPMEYKEFTVDMYYGLDGYMKGIVLGC